MNGIRLVRMDEDDLESILEGLTEADYLHTADGVRDAYHAGITEEESELALTNPAPTAEANERYLAAKAKFRAAYADQPTDNQ